MTDTTVGAGIVVRARRRLVGIAKWFSRTAKVMAVAGSVTFAGLLALSPGPEMPALIAVPLLAATGLLMLSPIVGLVSLALRVGGFRREGRLEREGSLLRLGSPDGKGRVLGQAARSGVIVPNRGSYEVLIELTDGNEVSVVVDDEETAEAVLELAGVGPERRRTRVRWAGLARRIGYGAGGFLLALVAATALLASVPEAFSVAALFSLFVAPPIIGAAASRFFAWRELEVGSDGVSFFTLGRREILPLRDLAAVEVRGEQLVLSFADGSTRSFVVERAGLAEGLRHRIDEVLSTMGRAEGMEQAFERGELSFSEWTQRMRATLTRGGTLREAPVNVAVAVRVLEDADADPASRVGAALALGQTDAPELLQRVRVAADTCVSPKLRVALTEAAAGEVEEEVLHDALEELRMTRP